MSRWRMFVVVAILMTGPLTAGILRGKFNENAFYVRAPQTNPVLLKAISLDLASSMASVKWLELMNFYGDRLLRRHVEMVDYRWMWKSLQSQLYLDPFSLDTYVFASGVFPWRAQKPEYSLQLLLYGALKRTQDWRIYFSLGYHLFAFFNQPKLAAEVWEMASHIDGRPKWLPALTTMLLYEKRDLDGALAFLGALAGEEGGGAYGEELQNMRRTIKMVQKLQIMADDYQKKEGHTIRSLDDLRRAGYYGDLPKDPFGGSYFWDAKSGRVDTTTRMIPHRDKAPKYYRWNPEWLKPEVAQNLLDSHWNLR